MRMTKKITPVVLVVLMVVSMMSVMAISASASEYKASVNGTSYTSFTDALQAAADNDTILLLDNVNINSEITIDKKIILDINGFTFSGNGISVANNKELTVKNGTLSSQIYVENGAVLNINPDAVLSLTSRNADFIIVRNGTVNIRGNVSANSNSPALYLPGGYSNSVVNVYSGIIRGKHAVYMDDGTANIQGGNFDGNMAVCVKGGTVNISGGTFTNNALYVESGTVQVSGGKFSEEVNPQYLVNGYSCIENDDGTYSVGICVARVGNARFTGINDAVSAAQGGGTVVLLADYGSQNVSTTLQNKKLTLDLNGNTFSNTLYLHNSDITVMDSSAAQDGCIISNGIYMYNSEFTLNSGTISSDGSTLRYRDANGANKITINGGTICSHGSTNIVIAPQSADIEKDTIIINGGTFYATGGYSSYGTMISKGASDYLYINGGDFSQHDITNRVNRMGFDFDENTFISGGKFPEYRSNSSGVEYGNDQYGPLPAYACAKGYEPTEKIDDYYYTVKLKDNPLDDFETSAADAKTADTNNFQLEDNYNAGALLGVQMKTKDSVNAPVTSEGHQETGKDLRFIAALDTALLNKAEDYGFVVAQTDAFDGNIEKKVDNTNFSRVSKGNVKTISAKGTYNNVCGNVAYGDPYDYSTNYKYITFAVNDIPDGKKIVTRFYVTIDGKTYYAKYAKDNYAGGYTGCIAGINAGSVY